MMRDNNKMNHELEPLLTSHQKWLENFKSLIISVRYAWSKQKVVKNVRKEFEKEKKIFNLI